MKKVLFALTALLITCVSSYAQNQWSYVGSPGFSDSSALYSGMVTRFDNSGTEYVAYIDRTNTSIAVWKFDGSNWVPVGPSSGFSPSNSLYLDMAIYNNVPYVAFQDRGAGRGMSVMKYDGSNWVYVGNRGFSNSVGSYTSMAIDANGVIYVSYTDGGIEVKKFNGTSWVNAGNVAPRTGGATNGDIAIDQNNVPYICYTNTDSSSRIIVEKLVNNNWAMVGNNALGVGLAMQMSMRLTSAGLPVVAFRDGRNSNKATVMQYDGSSWNSLGTPGFATNFISYPHLALDKDDTPYISFLGKEYNSSYYLSAINVMKYDGTNWVYFSSGTDIYAGINSDASWLEYYNDKLYYAYEDFYNGRKISVKNIDLNDTIPPVITCPVSATASCNTAPSFIGTATATDAGGIDTITYADSSTYSSNPADAAHYNYTIYRKWTATDNSNNSSSCTQVITVSVLKVSAISVNPSPTVSGQAANTIFLGYGPQSVTLSATATGGVGTYTYSWSPTGGSAASTTVAPTTATIYTLTVADSGGCSLTSSQSIDVIDVRDGNKIKVCHNGHTNSVAYSAVQAHLNHGDQLGDCAAQAKGGRQSDEEANQQDAYFGNSAVLTTPQFRMYPNPAGELVKLTFSGINGSAQVKITSLTGRVLYSNTIDNKAGDINIPLSNIPSGVYMVELQSDNARTVQKLIRK